MSRTIESICKDVPTNKSLRMPAEWENHQCCLILFPHSAATFRLDKAQSQVLQVAHAIAKEGEETVYLLVKDEQQYEQLQVEPIVQASEGSIRVHLCPSDDTWVRDTGPTCVWSSAQELLGLDWDFNAYGGPDDGCYWPCEEDKKVASKVCKELLRIPSIPISLVLEGGSIHTDGEGTLLVTKECLLNPNRNPSLSQDVIEGVLKKSLGVEVVIWLPHGVDADDDTNGHVDNFCCFSKPGQVVLAWTDDKINDKPNYERCREALEVLTSAKDAKGRNFEVCKLELPPPIVYSSEEVQSLSMSGDFVSRREGEKMAASYINFYIANKAIITPQFGTDEADAKAIQTLQGLFPDRTVVGVQSKEILMGGGNIHCITQQIPG